MGNTPFPSYWESDAYFAPTDVLIIGAGLVGLNAALRISETRPDLDVRVIDRGVFPIGASTRNAGFACFGSITELISDIESMGQEEALGLVEKRKLGLEELFRRVSRFDCGYEHNGGAEVFTSADETRFAQCMDRIEDLNASLRQLFDGDAFVYNDDLLDQHGIRGCRHLISHPYEGQLHPGRMMRALEQRVHAAGVQILRGINVVSLADDGGEVVAATHAGTELIARHLIVATNGFARDLLPDIQLVPARNQVLLTHPMKDFRLKGCFHYNAGYVYFRNVGDRLLIGGARHIDLDTEETDAFGLTRNITGWLTDFAQRHLVTEAMEPAYAWSGIMGTGPDKQPIVRNVGQRIVAAVRLGGMGVAIGSLVGNEAADLILQKL